MMDPLARATIERDLRLLEDPEIEMSAGFGERGFQICFVRRRGIRNDPRFRFRNPDRA